MRDAQEMDDDKEGKERRAPVSLQKGERSHSHKAKEKLAQGKIRRLETGWRVEKLEGIQHN